METNEISTPGVVRDPKDEKITNKDDSITNKDEDLKKGEQQNEQNKPDQEHVPTVTPDNENGKPGAPEDEEESSSNVGQGPGVENL